MNREQLHEEAIKLASSNNSVILEWTTGVGKSFGAINIINYYQSKANRPLRILLIVAEVAHKKNWVEEFKKWKFEYNYVTMECYASLKKYANTQWDIVIADEVHRIASDKRLDYFSSIKHYKFVGLSATIPTELYDSLRQIRGDISVSKVSLKQAIKHKILPEPEVYIIPLKLNNTNPTEIIIEEWGLASKRKTIKCTYDNKEQYYNRQKNPNVRLEITATQQQKYNYYSEQMEYYKNRFFTTQNFGMKNKWLQYGSKRKIFLGECKTSQAKFLLKKVKNKRFICFCTNIEQAEELGKDYCVHSKNKNSLGVVDEFNNTDISKLFAVGMLQEGMNLTNIEVGIIIQLDGKEKGFKQKFGRTLRAENPIQFIFYYENTQDEKYLENVLEGVEEKYITRLDTLINFKL